MTFIDNFSCYTEVVLLNRKDKTLDAFKKFVMCAKSKLGRHIVHFRLDGGSKFTSKEFAEYCGEKGITHEMTNLDMPQQNGVTEHKN